MFGRIFTVGGYTLLSRLTGFARDIMLAAILGAGPVADAFFVALRLPNHFRAIFAEGAFNAAFVPAYAHVHGERGETSARLFADRIFTLLFFTQLVLLVVAWLFMPQAMSILAPGFTDDAEHLSLSAPDHAGDVVRRDAQRHAPFRQRRGGPDSVELVDDDDAGAGGIFPERRPRRRMGCLDLRLPAVLPAGRRSCASWRPATVRAAEARRGRPRVLPRARARDRGVDGDAGRVG